MLFCDLVNVISSENHARMTSTQGIFTIGNEMCDRYDGGCKRAYRLHDVGHSHSIGEGMVDNEYG